ncbi:MAG: CoA transferase [Pseudomonadales bacterium]
MTGREPVNELEIGESPPTLASSFAVSAAAQTSIAAAALAGAEFWSHRTGARQLIRVPRAAAELECTGYFTLDGQVPEAWAKYSGLYGCSDGHVRIHANFDHHRDGVLALLGLPPGESAPREAVASALQPWRAADFEEAAAQQGLVVAMARSFEEWDRHPHALAAAQLPLLTIDRIDDAKPLADPPISADQAPLTGIRVLDLTRILAGPICGRTLAAYGADVMLINSPHLPNIESIADTSRGKRSAHIDLSTEAGRGQLGRLLETAHLFVQGYRPGGLSALGFSPGELAQRRPGIVAVSLSAYGPKGPWAERRGFDSLVQTATGFNVAEGEASAAANGVRQPKALPVPILDYASGFLMAFGAQTALLRQRIEGGSWHVQVSLLQTANWLRSLGRIDNGFAVQRPKLADHLLDYPCTHAKLRAMPHAAEFSVTPAHWRWPSALPGEHPAAW